MVLTLGACKGGTGPPTAPIIEEPPGGEPSVEEPPVEEPPVEEPPVQPTTTFQLAVSKAGSGTGLVTSSPPGINCGRDCSEDYAEDSLVSLAATPGTGSAFRGWSRNCLYGLVTMLRDYSCTATFDAQPAGSVTFSFQGVIGQGCFGGCASSDDFGAGVPLGTPVTGSFTFSPNTPPTPSFEPSRVDYEDDPGVVEGRW